MPEEEPIDTPMPATDEARLLRVLRDRHPEFSEEQIRKALEQLIREGFVKREKN